MSLFDYLVSQLRYIFNILYKLYLFYSFNQYQIIIIIKKKKFINKKQILYF
jgi:hypothetical protein